MKEYKFEIKKDRGMYEIRDADENQLILTEPMVMPFGALVAFYRKLSAYCYQEMIGGVSIYGNQRDLPYVYAVLRDKECQREANTRLFEFGKSEHNRDVYEVWMLILDGPTLKFFFPRHALLDLCFAIFDYLKSCEEPKIKIWSDYVLNKMAEDVELDFELFCKWIQYVHPETPGCYYEVWFDAYDRIDDHLTLRQNIDIAAAYIKDHEHDYD